MNLSRIITELRISLLESQLRRDRDALVDLCRKRGSQYAVLDASYTDDEDFLVIDGWRADEDAIDDPSIEVPGEVVAYIDTHSGRVVYVNPDARWDSQCQDLIQEKVRMIKTSIKPSVPVPVVVHYSFDSEVPVTFCDSFEAAQEYLKKDYEEEVRIQIEENGHVMNEDVWASHSDDWTYASIRIDTGNGEEPDLMEWSIGSVKTADTESASKTCLIATNIDWDCDDEDDAAVLPETVILPESVTEDDAVDYLTDKYEYCIKSLKTISAAKGW